ncbi:hypothetical protein C8T65DRAFT_736296 [Cerioporus squamosus]|nr:hypothetical protein C8T65DRAFT_736296 [Cerioporus squamosus]
MSDLVTVDDLAYDQLRYSNSATLFWNPVSLPDDPNVWDGGVQVASQAGLSVEFSFTGSQISVYGRVVPAVGGAQQPLSLYSVGSQKLQAFIPDDVTEATDNVAFFNSSVLPYGQYTLVVNVTRVDADAPYSLDYFRYNTTNPNAASGSSSSTSSTGAATGTGSVTETQVDSSGASSSSSPPVGAIVGGVLGGVALLAAAVFAFFCYRIRKRRLKIFLSPNGEKSSPTSVTPYVLPDHSGSQARFSDIPSLPAAGQYGSTHSLGTAPPSDRRSSKAAMARQERYLHPPGAPSGSSAHGDEYLGAPAPGSSLHTPSSHSSSHPSSRSHTHTHSNHSPLSTVRDLPTFAPRGKVHAKGTRSESVGLLGAAAGPSSPAHPHAHARQPQDSGLRFDSGVTPSAVAPVLPPGATPGPIRSAGTMSEVARADVPPAYTPD